MPTCSWCGGLVSASDVKELHNGASLLRLCPGCAQTELGRKLTARRRSPDPDESSEVGGLPRWMQVTALVVLLAFVAPLVITVLSRLR
jgi:hypothetical protein